MCIRDRFTGVQQLTAYNDELIFTGLANQQFGIYKLDSSIFEQAELAANSLVSWKTNFKNHDYTLGNNKKTTPQEDYRNYIFDPSVNPLPRVYNNPDTTAVTDSKKYIKEGVVPRKAVAGGHNPWF